MLATACPTRTRILTELPPKLNLESNCESLHWVLCLECPASWAARGAERTRWSLEGQMDDKDLKMLDRQTV